MQTVTISGIPYLIPETGEDGWGDSVTKWIVAITNSTLRVDSSSFPLQTNINFGSIFGLIANHFTSTSINPSASGVVRLSVADSVGWRNTANTNDNLLTPKTNSNTILTYNAIELVNVTDSQTLSNKTFSSPNFTGAPPTYNSNVFWTAGNMGTGSGLDADLLDGINSTGFALSGHNHDTLYYTQAISDGRYLQNLTSTSIQALGDVADVLNPSTGFVLTWSGTQWVAQVVPGLSGTGEVNTASNVNTAGVGVWKQKVGVNLEFKGINAASSKLTVVNTVGTNSIDVDVVEANLSLLNLAGTLTIAKGGTGNTTANPAFNALSPLTTKGDIVAFSTVNTRLPVGTNTQVLTADSTQTTGLKWTTPAAATTIVGLTDVNIVSPTNSQLLAYDSVQGKWINSTVSALARVAHPAFFHDFEVNPVNDGKMSQTLVGTGASVQTGLEQGTNWFGSLELSTGSTTTGGVWLYEQKAANAPIGFERHLVRFDTGVWTFETTIALNVLSISTNEYKVRIGFMDGDGGGVANGAFFLYDRLTSGLTTWYIVGVNGGTSTVTPTVNVVTTVSTKLRIVVASGVATYYVNGASIGTVSTNLPTSTRTGFGLTMLKNGAGTNAGILYSDYVIVAFDPTVGR